MAQFEVLEDNKVTSRLELGAGSQTSTGNISGQTPQPTLKKVPGLSYIPERLEIAEDQVLLSKIQREMLDFIKILAQLLDLMWLVKPKHLRHSQPIPAVIIEELLINRGKGPRLKALDAKLLPANPVASASVEFIIKSQIQSHQPMPPQRRDLHPHRKSNQHGAVFPFANDLQEITGKKTRPLWQFVVLEKPEELSILQPRPPRVPSFVFKTKTAYQECRINEELERTKSETTLFTTKFAWENMHLTFREEFQHQKQIEMMVASAAGFRTVEEHKAYLSTLKSHWYNNFLNDVIKLGILTCSELVTAFENLATHYNMNYNSLPLAKAKLCLVVMSLPFWDIARIETQRAVEFILEKILLLPEKPLVDWLRVRSVPYVVFPAYTAEDLMTNGNVDEDVASAIANSGGGGSDKDQEATAAVAAATAAAEVGTAGGAEGLEGGGGSGAATGGVGTGAQEVGIQEEK